MTNNSPELELKKKALLWQCRRGIKEIEVLLIPFLNQHFQNESTETQILFEELLAEEDLDIFEWFTRRVEPDNERIRTIVDILLSRLGN